MPNYQMLYSQLFNALTDVLGQLDAMNYGEAKALIIKAQRFAEEEYISAENEGAE